MAVAMPALESGQHHELAEPWLRDTTASPRAICRTKRRLHLLSRHHARLRLFASRTKRTLSPALAETDCLRANVTNPIFTTSDAMLANSHFMWVGIWGAKASVAGNGIPIARSE
jgi:hypothetical protein